MATTNKARVKSKKTRAKNDQADNPRVFLMVVAFTVLAVVFAFEAFINYNY